MSFVFTGVIVLASAVYGLLVVPRKIRMPHVELGRVLKEGR